jgi:hypothetical protein
MVASAERMVRSATESVEDSHSPIAGKAVPSDLDLSDPLPRHRLHRIAPELSDVHGG